MTLTRQTILVVEDEVAIAETIIYGLQTEGFAVVWKTTGREALAILNAQPIALVVLDVGLPDASGFDVCRELRKTHAVPVIFLTARSAEVDRIVGLELGADDYVAKPFSPRELTARVRAVLRRMTGSALANGNANTAASDGPWSHDEARCRISYRGRP
ncbi:MAG TPA: response regulator, partial [Opitutus sp.]|nr:response regulator [Opitutus sp.]